MRRLLLALLLASPVSAHDFWLQPGEFWPAGETTVSLLVGHGPDRQRSPIPASRFVRFEAEAGADLWVLETDDRAQSHLPALRFNDYLTAEGLTPAIEERKRSRHRERDGSENYRRCAKAILKAGSGGGAAVTRPVGLTLEIVPERDPYAQPHDAALPIRVFYRGAPLAGALVKFTDLDHDEQPVETHRTDAEGRAIFAAPDHGSWLLNVVWTEVQPPSKDTDFDTSFSSLTFGFPRR